MNGRGATPRIAVVCLVCLLVASAADGSQFTNAVCGYTVMYPDAWNARMHPDGRNLIIANYPKGSTPKGESFPPGGARITIAMFPPYNAIFRAGDDDNAMFARMVTPNTAVISQTSASGAKPARLVAELPMIGVRAVTVLVHQQGKLFFFNLSCGTADPNCSGYEHVLDSVMESLTAAAATPGPTSASP